MEFDFLTVKDSLEGMFGYKANQEEEEKRIKNCFDYTIQYLKNYLNRTDIPSALEFEIIKMTCAEYLYRKALLGQLKDGQVDFDLTNRVSQWSEGDTSISISRSTDTGLDAFVQYLNKMRKGSFHMLEHFRKVHW